MVPYALGLGYTYVHIYGCVQPGWMEKMMDPIAEAVINKRMQMK